MNRNMGHNQWYVHMSRVEGADNNHIKKCIKDLQAACAKNNVNCAIGFGPTLIKDLTSDVPADFTPYPGYKAADGSGNPDVSEDVDVMLVPKGQPGADGTFVIAQRWVHDLKAFHKLSLPEQEAVFGRTKADSTRLEPLPEQSHVNHVELREKHGDVSSEKVRQMSRRSTPYAFHDGTVGLYFMGFCKSVKPLDERMRMMYGMDGQVRDAVTTYSQPASGSYYFFPSNETFASM